MSVWGKVKGRRRAFLSLLLDGESPQDACEKIWPSVTDIHGHITRVMSDIEFKATHTRLSEYQRSKEVLIAKCQKVADDEESSPTERINAVRLLARIEGYVDNALSAGGTRGYASKTLRPSVKPIEESQLLQKMAELGKKVTVNGHPQKPS